MWLQGEEDDAVEMDKDMRVFEWERD